MEYNGIYYKLFKDIQSYSDILNFVVENPYSSNIIKLNSRYLRVSEINQNLELRIDEFNSINWEIFEPDNEMNDKVEKIRDKIYALGIDIDSRFYDLYKMSIHDIFNYLYQHNYFDDDELASFILNKK